MGEELSRLREWVRQRVWVGRGLANSGNVMVPWQGLGWCHEAMPYNPKNFYFNLLFFSSSTNFLMFLWVPPTPFYKSPSISTSHVLPSRQAVGRECTANSRHHLSVHLFTAQTLTEHLQCAEPCPGPGDVAVGIPVWGVAD